MSLRSCFLQSLMMTSASSLLTSSSMACIPDNIPLPELADSFVRGKRKLSREQQSMLKELLPYHMPKLTAVAHFQGSFYEALEQAIEKRANRPPPSLVIEGKAVPVEPLPAD